VQEKTTIVIKTLYDRDFRYYDPPFTKLRLQQHVLRISTIEVNTQLWIDGYSGQVSFEGAILSSDPKIDQQVVNFHPCGLSLKKVNQFWLREDGSL
jgi:hypothetical protein